MSATAGRPRARALSAALRSVREERGIGVRELARRLDVTHVEISNWETGSRVANVEKVAMILAALSVKADQRERILDLARNANEPNWLTVGVKGIPEQLAGVVEHELAATEIVDWSPMLIPGLLQTSDYTRAIKRAGGLPEKEVELRLMVNAGRLDVIKRVDKPIQFEGFIGESALRDRIVSREIMADQLRNIIDLTRRANVVTRVVRLGIGWHPGLLGPFKLFVFPDSSPVVYFEHHSSGLFIHTEYDVSEYKKAVDMLRKVSLDPVQSLDFIDETLNAMEVSP